MVVQDFFHPQYQWDYIYIYMYIYLLTSYVFFLIMGLSTIIDDVPFLADVPHFTPIIMRMDHLFKCSIVNEDELPTEIIYNDDVPHLCVSLPKGISQRWPSVGRPFTTCTSPMDFDRGGT